MSVRLIYQDIAVGAAEDATITTNGAQPRSNVTALPFGVETPPLATCEWNHWALDGSFELYDGQPVAYWSTAMSGADGAFTTQPMLTIEFDQQYTSMGVYLGADTATGDYCSRVSIAWYRGSTLLDQADFTPTSPAYFCERTVVAYNRITITLRATALPYRYAKLSHIIFGVYRYFQRDELRSAKITEEADLISTEAAINTLDFTLDSKDNVDYMFQLKQPVYAYDGDALIGVFYIDRSTRRASRVYDVSCIDAIGVLDEDTIPAAIYSNKPAGELLEEILGGRFVLELAEDLQGEKMTGYLPESTRRAALHQVAFALRAVVDTSGSDAIRVYRPRTDGVAEIPASRIYTGGSVSTDAITTAVKVTAHTYSTSGSGSDTVEVGGVTYYHSAAVTTIENPIVTAGDKRRVVEVQNATLVNPANVSAVAKAVYDHYARRETHSAKIVMSGERPGDYVTTTTPWGTQITGHITSMHITLSGIAAADCEIIGEQERTT